MKIKKFGLLSLTVLLMAVSCSRDDDPTPTPTPPPPVATITPDPINNFVYKAMNSWYYWQEKVPVLADNYFKTPNDYAMFINGKTPDKLFYELLYDYGNTDQFSWIENNNEIINSSARVAEVEDLTGLEVSLFPKGGGSNLYIALVNYVVPNSSADQKGIKRGDVITKVNGSYLTASNYGSLFSASFTVTRADSVAVAVVNSAYVVTTTDKVENIAITKTSIEENPIAHYQVFTISGRKIGYLVYNGFKIDFNDELNAVFGKMKTDGVQDLILDLRYNGGGSLTTALGLGQMVTGGYTGQPYVFLDFNSKHNAYDDFDNLQSTIDIYRITNGNQERTGETQTINSLNLPRLYTLVSFQTASASELTVISLNKFIPVTTIGYATVGKFVGSNTLYDSPAQDYLSYENRNKNHNWKLQPITFAYYNKDKDPHPTVQYSNGDTVPGILPVSGNRVHPYEWIGKIGEFGVTTDPELKRALELITGQSNFASTSRSVLQVDRLKVLSKPMNPAKGLFIPDMREFIDN